MPVLGVARAGIVTHQHLVKAVSHVKLESVIGKLHQALVPGAVRDGIVMTRHHVKALFRANLGYVIEPVIRGERTWLGRRMRLICTHGMESDRQCLHYQRVSMLLKILYQYKLLFDCLHSFATQYPLKHAG